MVARLAQSGFSGGEIAPSLLGRTDLEKYSLALLLARNVLITKYGGLINRPGTQFIGEVYDSAVKSRLEAFQFSTLQAYVLEFSHLAMRPIAANLPNTAAGLILETGGNVVSISQASPGVVEITAHGFTNGQKVYPLNIGGMIQLMDGRVFTVRNVTTDTFTLEDMWGNAVNTTAYSAFTSGGTFSHLYQLTTPYDGAHLFNLCAAQTADTAFVTHSSYAVHELTRSAHAAWTITPAAFQPQLAAPGSPSAVATNGSGPTTYSYKVAAYSDETGEESLPSAVASCTNDLTTAGYFNTITWAAVPGADRYYVYKEEAGAYGLIGGTTGLSFKDDNILPDLGDTPQGARNPFGGASDYPAVCGFEGGRLVLGGTINEPGGVWMSQTGRYKNFNVATPAKADDAVSFVLSPGVNAVRGFVSLSSKLAVFTSEREFTASGGGVQESITPASLSVAKHTRRGCSDLIPLEVGDIALFVQRQGSAVRSYGYSFEKDGFRSNDLTLLAPHLFRGRQITDWCYQQDPHSIVWCVRDDGALLALTFVEEQNTFAWTVCEIGGGGIVESCACIEGTDEDDVWLTVRRVINGQTKRYIERLVPRWDGDAEHVSKARFLDSHVVVETAVETSRVGGLWHLEGREDVMALVDGNVQGPFTVSGGSIDLATPIKADGRACIGFGYESLVVDLPVNQQTQTGARQGRYTGVNAVVLKLHRSRGLEYGLASKMDRAAELKTRQFENWNDPSEPYSGDTLPLTIDGGWDLNGSIFLRQRQPLPMEVLMIARDVTVGGP